VDGHRQPVRPAPVGDAAIVDRGFPGVCLSGGNDSHALPVQDLGARAVGALLDVEQQ
jgi:hypothetical protein